jgi:hypothetical protein
VSEDAAKKGWWNPMKVGLALSGLVLLCFVAMAHQRNCVLLDTSVLECQRNWAWFWTSKPNEIGDTLAGFAGVLAFIWIIVTVALQSSELRQQRAELGLTREELKLARHAQERQLQVMQKQADIFDDEKHRRDQEVNRQYIRQLVRSTVSTIRYSEVLAMSWHHSLTYSNGQGGHVNAWSLLPLGAPQHDTEDAFLIYARNIIHSSLSLEAIMQDKDVRIAEHHDAETGRKRLFLAELNRLTHLCQEAIFAREASSSIEQELLGHLRLDELHEALKSVKSIFNERLS